MEVYGQAQAHFGDRIYQGGQHTYHHYGKLISAATNHADAILMQNDSSQCTAEPFGSNKTIQLASVAERS